MPRKRKVENLPFNTEKDIAEGKAVKGAPIVGGEFVTEDWTDADWAALEEAVANA